MKPSFKESATEPMAIDESVVTGRVVRFLTKHSADSQFVEQWFLVGIDDDERAIEAVSMREPSEDKVVEVVGVITPPVSSKCRLTAGEVRLVLPGEPICES
ncbi:MAG: hypothetical protein JJE37_12670 [Methyloceanibacter sp.]|nr:hypothetical protein [Methyloceanibacter sp.]